MIGAAWITGGATVLAAVIAGVVAFATREDEPTPPAPATTTAVVPEPRQGAPSAVVTARIINTGGIGVSKFEEPTNTSGRAFGPSDDGVIIEVVCQVRDGQPLTDPNPSPGQPSNWPVWNKLPDGYYIPDLYTDLPKEPGSTPPNGLPVC